MTRPSTRVRDLKIMQLYTLGKDPKRIARRYRMSVWAVYKAILRIQKINLPNFSK